LIARESNQKAIDLYQSMGFLIEGRLEMRIKSLDGHYEADIPMGWQNPNFEF
jgi:ribosomal protein S18 acetylase RimI-like enzyme